MSNQSVTVDATDFPVATYRNVRVITTELLAQAFGTEPVRIQQGHMRNTERFIEGKHFYKLAGPELQDFATIFKVVANPSKVRSLILWTERGAARHAKILESAQAWEVFEKLEDAYFHRKDKPTMDRPDLQPVEAKTSNCLDNMEFRVTLSEWEHATTVTRDSQATVERIRLVARISREAMQGIRAVSYENQPGSLCLVPLQRELLKLKPRLLDVLNLKRMGYAHTKIAKMIGISETSVRRDVDMLGSCGFSLAPLRSLPAPQQMTLQFDGGAA